MRAAYDAETGLGPWTSRFRDRERGLVHLASASLFATVVCTPTGVYPSLAWTSCGIQILAAEVDVACGEFFDEPVPLTCVACLGEAKDGRRLHYSLKQVAFAHMYGLNSVQACERLMSEDTEWVLGAFRRSLYRRCQRLAKRLFAKALG